MSVAENLPEKEEEKENVVPFVRPKRGGTGTPTYFKNWLAELEEGTKFLTRVKDPQEVTLTEVVVYNNKPEKATLLLVIQPNREYPLWVDTVRFSTNNELVEVLQVKEKEEDKENE